MIADTQKPPVLFCFRCGETIPRREDLAATFTGTFHRWDERLMGNASFNLCKACLEATDMFLDEEKREAMLKIKKMSEEFR